MACGQFVGQDCDRSKFRDVPAGFRFMALAPTADGYNATCDIIQNKASTHIPTLFQRRTSRTAPVFAPGRIPVPASGRGVVTTASLTVPDPVWSQPSGIAVGTRAQRTLHPSC